MRMSVHPLFVVFITLALFSGFGGIVVTMVLAVLIHEFGHVVMASHFGVRTQKLRLLPFGAQIEIEAKFLGTRERVLILLAGPFANIIVALSCGVLLWLFPMFFGGWESFIIANSIGAVLNLLPIYPLDSGKILYLLFGGKRVRWVRWFIRAFSTFVFAGLFIAGIFVWFSPMVVLMAGAMVFMLNIEFRGSEFTTKFNRSLPRVGKVVEVAVTSDMTLLQVYKLVGSNYTKFVVVDRDGFVFTESELEKWLLDNESNAVLVGFFSS